MNRALSSLEVLLTAMLLANSPTAADPLKFTAAPDGGFKFDTGELRGTLRPAGKSLGLLEVIHIPSGKRLDRSNGLFSHYRVFTKGVRYGGGAWDWPSQAALLDDGAVEVHWPSTEQRPFEMRALYRWRTPDTLDLETTVRPETDLVGFESFLASYLSESFTNAAVYASASPANGDRPGFIRFSAAGGAWQMFPRNNEVLSLIKDGRWRMEPNPVDWTIRTPFEQPLAYRRDPASGLTAMVMSRASDCFAIAGPEETEGHRSLYLSLFGRDLKAGKTAVAQTRLIIRTGVTDEAVLRAFQAEAGQPR